MGALRLAILAVGLTACGPEVDQLRKRAAFDLECPEARLSVVDLGARTRGVSGCGRHAVYINRGEWIMNSP